MSKAYKKKMKELQEKEFTKVLQQSNPEPVLAQTHAKKKNLFSGFGNVGEESSEEEI